MLRSSLVATLASVAVAGIHRSYTNLGVSSGTPVQVVAFLDPLFFRHFPLSFFPVTNMAVLSKTNSALPKTEEHRLPWGGGRRMNEFDRSIRILAR